MTDGRCLCGTVRYQADGPWQTLLHCHCSMCRKHHGGSFATFASTALSGFSYLSGQDAVASYASSPSGQRSFCTVCGAVAPVRLDAMGLALCPAGNLDGDLGIKPQGHMFAASRAPWTTLDDGLPRWDEFPTDFGPVPTVERPTLSLKPGVTQGGCLCGQVAYQYSGAPVRMRNCHCSRCRRSRSAAFSTTVFVPEARFRWGRGAAQVVVYKLPEAEFFSTAFCRHCGSTLPWLAQGPGVWVIPAGSLDDDPGLLPESHIFVGSKASWYEISDALPRWDTRPPPA
jgi:hypothetical protein